MSDSNRNNSLQQFLITGHLIGCGKKKENYVAIFRNITRKKSEDYAEKMPDYVEISINNKVVPLAFLNV